MRWALRYAVLGLALGPASLQGCDVAADSMGEAWQFSTLLTFHLASVANHFLLAAKAAPSVIRSLCFPSIEADQFSFPSRSSRGSDFRKIETPSRSPPEGDGGRGSEPWLETGSFERAKLVWPNRLPGLCYETDVFLGGHVGFFIFYGTAPTIGLHERPTLQKWAKRASEQCVPC